FRRKFIKNMMRSVFIVKIADAGMVPSDQCMRTTVVFHNECVQYRFTRPCKNVRYTKRSQNCSFCRIIRVQHAAISKHPELVARISALRHLDKRLDEQSVELFQCLFMDILVPAVKRVGSRDESSDRLKFLFLVK